MLSGSKSRTKSLSVIFDLFLINEINEFFFCYQKYVLNLTH